MIKQNTYQYLSNIHCPVKDDLEPIPFCHLGSESNVPRKCILCTYMFEGECLWEKDKKPETFSLNIIQAEHAGSNALEDAYREVVNKFIPLSYTGRILFVIEGNVEKYPVSEINDITMKYQKMISKTNPKKEFLLGVYQNSLSKKIIISVVQEL